MLASGLAAQFDLAVTHPTTGKLIEPVSLLSVDGLHRILTGLVTNFTSFAPLGTVLVAMIGIGVAEVSGLIGALMRMLVRAIARALLTPVVVFAGVMSNAASEVGYVLLVPLAALIFKAAGRQPVLGLAAAFAGVSGGYSANLVLGTIDPLLAGLSQEAARIIDPSYVVSPAANYYFMAASTFLITGLGWWVTERVVAPRLGGTGVADAAGAMPTTPTPTRRNGARSLCRRSVVGLRFALVVFLVLTGLLLWGLVPSDGFPARSRDGSVLHSPFLQGIVSLIFLFGVALGVAYGIGAGTVRSDRDVIKGMSQQMSTLGGYLVLVFFAAQFVAFFNWTNLGLILAVDGAEFLKSAGLHQVPADAVVRPALGVDQPDHGLGIGQVGDDGAGVRADVHAARLSAGADAGGLSRRRLGHQRHLADDELFRADHRVRAALRREGGHRYAGLADAAVLAHLPGRMVGAARRLDAARVAGRTRRADGADLRRGRSAVSRLP